MYEMTLKDREVLICLYAMRTFMFAIEQVRDTWRPEDIEIAKGLLQKLENQRTVRHAAAKAQDAQDTNRS